MEYRILYQITWSREVFNSFPAPSEESKGIRVGKALKWVTNIDLIKVQDWANSKIFEPLSIVRQQWR